MRKAGSRPSSAGDTLLDLGLGLGLGLVLVLALALPVRAAVDQSGTSAGLRGKLITVSAVPSGWVSQQANGKAASPCLNIFDIGVLHLPAAEVAYGQNGGGEVFAEGLDEAPSGAKALSVLARVRSEQAGCNNSTFQSDGHTGHLQVSTLNVPAVGAHSSARALTVSVAGSTYYVNIVTFVQGRLVGFLAQSDSTGATPDVATEAQLDQVALNRLQGGTGGPGSSAGASVGGTQDVVDEQGNQLAVTLVRLIDPAQPVNGLPVLGGGLLVGVELKVTNRSDEPEILAPSDVSLGDDADHSYSSSGQAVTGCTDLATSGSLGAGATVDGCFSFPVPTGATPATLTFTPFGSPDEATWHLG
jgi:hypothetical protein